MAYRIGLTLKVEAAVFGQGWQRLAALEEHLPDIIVCRAEKP